MATFCNIGQKGTPWLLPPSHSGLLKTFTGCCPCPFKAHLFGHMCTCFSIELPQAKIIWWGRLQSGAVLKISWCKRQNVCFTCGLACLWPKQIWKIVTFWPKQSRHSLPAISEAWEVISNLRNLSPVRYLSPVFRWLRSLYEYDYAFNGSIDGLFMCTLQV